MASLGTKPAKVEGVEDRMSLLYQVLTRLTPTLVYSRFRMQKQRHIMNPFCKIFSAYDVAPESAVPKIPGVV
jgi:hypothetical protein